MTKFSQGVLDARRHFSVDLSMDEAIAFKLSQMLCEHPLRSVRNESSCTNRKYRQYLLCRCEPSVPLAVAGMAPENAVMVYSPRDEQEVNVILPCCTPAAYRSAGGRLPEQTERPIPGVKREQ